MNETTLMSRRHLLCCGVGMAMGLFTGLAAANGEGIEQAPQGLASSSLRDLVHAAFDGIEAGALWDAHAHLLGTGDAGSGCRVHPAMQQWWHPQDWLRRRVILDAAGVAADAPSIDEAYVARLLHLAADFPAGARWLLFAFEEALDDAGRPRDEWTTFHVPNEYAARVAAAHPQRFAWVASIHPYRDDAVERLDAAASTGALAVKWLPSAMNIDPRDARCRPFYDRLAKLGLPLIVHCGEEKAVPGAHREAFGNPLLMRVPLEQGVRVVVAHAASLGSALDTDRPGAPKVAAFDLFARLMDEPAWRDRLLADVSAVAQINRPARVLRTLVRRDDWHARLLHGSDHPLPGVKLLVSPARLAAADLLDDADVQPLERLRERSPLLFDLALKRRLRDSRGARFAPNVFETRRHFERPAATLRRDPPGAPA
ncbi:MAG TPA: amidohydrolase family protein [Methylibium sp.]|uniref:amidohydrolase family protein n=1 Tax=Methylibium sp. TaxID=2067992 RepID=UPI002DB98727|nr:amidohydrolase family protein [Methylibium sp.]HEU4458502.1 amidohydrolase family protein [Methylibium sp.]